MTFTTDRLLVTATATVAAGLVAVAVLPAMAVSGIAASTTPSHLASHQVAVHRAAPGDPPADQKKKPKKKAKVPVNWLGMSVMTPTLRRVGVAYPLLVTFAQPVKRRAVAERLMAVTVNGKPIKGAWSWRDSRTVQYRPRKGFWPGKSTIKLTSTLHGALLAVDRKPNGKPAREWKGGSRTDRVVKIRTARAFVAYIRDPRHVMIVTRNGKAVYHPIPVSLGKPGFETRSGIKVATEKYAVKRMVNTELKYDVMSPYSVRLTPTGEYIHGAPWATGRLGRWDGSHGCTNLGVADAKWYYDHVIYGDPVVTTGTGRPMEWWNGLGGPWNIPWQDWLARSALRGKS